MSTKNKRLIVTVTAIALVVVTAYILMFWGTPISKDPSYWGAFGDYLGGILNPIIAFASLILILKTLSQNEIVLMQSKQALIDSREEMKESTKQLSAAAQAQEKLLKLEKDRSEAQALEARKKDHESEIENIARYCEYMSDNYYLRLKYSRTTQTITELGNRCLGKGSTIIDINDNRQDQLDSLFNLGSTLCDLAKALDIKSYPPEKRSYVHSINRRLTYKYEKLFLRYESILEKTKLLIGNEQESLEENDKRFKAINDELNKRMQIIGNPVTGHTKPAEFYRD
ncbi:hypothetical protein [Bermanella sp. R86510]|uniref:hypothetical protein n=1 Tax=unclassified Bermanella TaxID=2627862 RepID=UPI0037C9735F